MTTDITHHLHASIDDDLGALHALDTDLATALRRLAFHGVNHLSDRELTRFAGHVKATLIQAQANAQREREILASRRGLVEPQQWPGSR